MTAERPILYYDAGCGFCRRWIPRWEQLTGDRVAYLGVTPGAEPAPDVDVSRAVQLALPAAGPDVPRRVLAGAAAVAELGAYTGRLPVFRALYRRVPGVAPLADLGYRAVARHRRLADRVTRLAHGPDLRRPRHALSRWLFLRLLAVCVLAAALSWWTQLDGLVGAEGIAPAVDLLEQVRAFAEGEGLAPLETLRRFPTLLWLAPSDATLHLLCALATLGGLLLLFNVLPGPALLACWLAWLSLVTTGGVFMGFQWDALLLEALLVALFLAPWRAGWRPGLAPDRAPSTAGLWLARLLVVKLMFLSGFVKLQSGDPAWADGTALAYHYWTQPLPAWTSWYAHHADWAHGLGLAFMFAAELALSWFLLTGPRRLRLLAVAALVALMGLIALTGNYGYFNLLSVALLVTALDDNAVRACVPARWRPRVPDPHAFAQRRPRLCWRAPVAALAAVVALVSLTRATQRAAGRDAPPAPLADLAAFLAPLHVANSYGLFATMTTERPEVLLEGSLDGRTWRPYAFPYKPGALDVTPGFAQPHMPRLDWQLWFAALAGDCRRVPWYPAFVQRLLEGSPPVLALLADDPFADDGPPRYVRSTLWRYRFTTPAERADTGHFWARDPAPAPFCPTLTLVDGALRVAAPGR